MRLILLLIEQCSAAVLFWPMGALELNRRIRGLSLEPQYNLDQLVGRSYQSPPEMEVPD